MEFLKIVGVSILAAIAYGILHDQVTARVCVEYFTIGHAPLFPTDSPTLLGLGWGVVATWWVGLMLGVPLAVVARAGARPKLTAHALLAPIRKLLYCMAAIASVAGIGGYLLGGIGAIPLSEPLASAVPPEKHARFLAAGAAHLASYLSGFIGGAAVCIRTWRRRRSMAPPAPTVSPPGSDPRARDVL